MLVIGVRASPVLARSIDLGRSVAFNIESQPLDSALIEFSKQARLQVAIAADAIQAGEASGVHGKVPISVALKVLLRNSGLKYEAVGRSISVTRVIEQPSTSAEVDAQQGGSDRASSVVGSKGLSESSENDSGRLQSKEVLQEVVIKSPYRFLSADTSGSTNLPLPIEQVPQSISLISDDFIKAADLKTLGEIAEYTPGAINVGNPGNFGTAIKLRGFDASQRVDGLNTGASLLEPDYAIFERLEVVKGPSSVVYGTSSPGGLVNFVTKSATPQTPSYIFAQVGSWSSYRIEGQAAGSLDGQDHIRAIGIAIHDQGLSFMHSLYHKRDTVYAGLNADLGSSVKIYVHGGFEREEHPYFDGIPTEPDGSSAPLPRKFFIGSRQTKVTTNAYHTEGELTWSATDVFDVSVKGNYQNTKNNGSFGYGYGLDADPTQPAGTFFTFAGRQSNYLSGFGLGASAIYRLDDMRIKNSFVSIAALYQGRGNSSDSFCGPVCFGTENIYNGEVAISRAINALNVDPFTDIANSRSTAHTLTISGQAIVQPIDPLTLLLGASYSKPRATSSDTILGAAYQDFRFKAQTSYRFGLTYELLPKTYAYVSYSQSFNPQASAPTIDNSIIPPLTGDQYEFGLKYRDEMRGLLLTAALFQIKEKNVLEVAEVTPIGQFFAPIGQVEHKGIELQGIGQITPQWQINAGYAYMDPKITAATYADPVTQVVSESASVGQTELYIPKQTFSLFSTYTLRLGALAGLSAGIGVRYSASVATSYSTLLANEQAYLRGFTKPLPSYALVDATLGYTREKWMMQLNLHNVLDRHYLINNYQTLFYGNVVGDPVNVSLSIRRQF
jgi:iron complex outermembrane receptor protein